MLIRVVIADDHVTVRRTLRTLLQRSGAVEVVGVAADGRQALVAIRELRPDVLILDLMMPHIDGFEVLDSLKSETYRPKVVVLSMNDMASTRKRALAEGAGAFVSKTRAHRELVEAIKRVMNA